MPNPTQSAKVRTMETKSTADAEYVNYRRTAALWYAWGAKDNDEAGGFRRVDAFAFADYYATEALRYRNKEAYTLASVQDAWRTYVGK